MSPLEVKMRDRMMLLGVISALLCASASWSMEDEVPAGPTTYLEFYERALECLTYFGRMSQELKKRGAAAEDIEPYDEMGFNFIWALSGFDRVLSSEELDSVTDAEINQRLDAYSDSDALRSAYDAICIDLHDNWKQHYDSIARRLEEQSGELYLDFKHKCVTVSTDLLTVTGNYLGMSGPSVEKAPGGGLSIPDPTDKDSFKVALPRGSLAYFATVEIPPPPGKHTRLLEMSPRDQARALARPVRKWGWDCKQPGKPFYRGISERGRAYWDVTCDSETAYSLYVDRDNKIHYSGQCDGTGGYEKPECYVPCERQSCYTLDPSISASIEYVPYTTKTRVERAPDELCAEMSGSVSTQFRDTLPELRRGKAHEPRMAIVDVPDCSALSSPLRLSLEIYATQRLDLLKLDLATLSAAGLAFDFSAGPPCELLHVDPLDSDYADLRCRLVGDPDVVMANGFTLVVRGNFKNGDPMEGRVEACHY
jgi:hypothetical protein